MLRVKYEIRLCKEIFFLFSGNYFFFPFWHTEFRHVDLVWYTIDSIKWNFVVERCDLSLKEATWGWGWCHGKASWLFRFLQLKVVKNRCFKAFATNSSSMGPLAWVSRGKLFIDTQSLPPLLEPIRIFQFALKRETSKALFHIKIPKIPSRNTKNVQKIFLLLSN